MSPKTERLQQLKRVREAEAEARALYISWVRCRTALLVIRDLGHEPEARIAKEALRGD